jgi:ribosomal protein L32E
MTRLRRHIGEIEMNELKREAEKIIEELRRAHRRSRKHGRGKYGFVRYLEQVYDQVATWRETPGMAKKMRKQIAKSAKLPKVTQKKGLFNVIIAATSVEPTRTKSRWGQALRYASKYRKQRGKLSLLHFFKKNGGPAGCATKYSRGVKPNL